jgi:general secretion pathway protein D
MRLSFRQLQILLGAIAAGFTVIEPMSLVAQTTAPTTEPSNGNGANGGATAEVRVPASTRPATTQISLNYKDASIDAVLEYLSDVAGFVIVKEVPVTGRVTVLSKQPVTPNEAVALLNTVLKTNGYTAIQMGRILKITARDRAK